MGTERNTRVIFTLILVMAICMGAMARDVGGSASRKADDAAIRENVWYMQEGWNTKSGALFAKPFAEDADYVVINGKHIQTQKLIAQGHQQIFDTIYKNSVLILSVKQIRFLRADVALVHVNGYLKIPQGETTKDGAALISMVMMKEARKWKIVAFQNTQVENEH